MSSIGGVAIGSVRKLVRLAGSLSSHGVRWRSAGGTAHLRDVTEDRPRLWTPQQLADYTGIPIRTLADWRTGRARRRGLGLPFVALSSHNVRYRESDVEAFIAGRIVGPVDRSDD